ncbi:MAG: hypothetical protein JJT85_07300 [Chromatiales bacterium]|nr:hypothetical protein [Chromatiales bacterium]
MGSPEPLEMAFAAALARRPGPPPGSSMLLRGEAGGTEQGVRIAFQLRVGTDGRILAAGFHAWACPHLLAACETLASGWLPGLPVAALAEPDWGDRLAALAIPAEKAGRLLVLADALRNCSRDWDTSRLDPS